MKDKSTVKITSHTGIAAAVPYLLGFVPTDSLVVIGLEGVRDRMSFTMRLDLYDDHIVLAGEVVRRMLAGGFDRVLLVIYTDRTFTHPDLPETDLVTDLRGLLEVREALLVQHDRVWSYVCEDIACCPPEGRTYLDGVDATNVAAAHILNGRSMLLTRDQVIDTVAAPSPQAAAPVLEALPGARDELVGLSTDDRVGKLGRLLAVCLARLDDPRTELTADDVAQFIALLDDAGVRDVLLRRIARTDDPAMRQLIAELARRTPTGDDAQVAVIVAVAAYLDGDGVVCRASLDRARATDPTHGMATAISRMLDCAVHPNVLRDALNQACC